MFSNGAGFNVDALININLIECVLNLALVGNTMFFNQISWKWAVHLIKQRHIVKQKKFTNTRQFLKFHFAIYLA